MSSRGRRIQRYRTHPYRLNGRAATVLELAERCARLDDDAYEALDLERGSYREDPYRHASPDSPYGDA